MKTVLIISGGDFAPDFYKQNSLPCYDCCIAADKGLEYAKMLGITPDYIIGDFDSTKKPIEDNLNDNKVLTFPIEKDDTDTMLAIKHAIRIGCTRIVIIGALGGRLDHTIANIQSMTYAANHGCICEILSENEYLRTMSSDIESSISLPRRDNTSLSIFSLTDISRGISIKGAKYDVENVSITNGFPLGVSNSWRDEEVIINLAEGKLLIVESFYRT